MYELGFMFCVFAFALHYLKTWIHYVQHEYIQMNRGQEQARERENVCVCVSVSAFVHLCMCVHMSLFVCHFTFPLLVRQELTCLSLFFADHTH